MAISSIHIEKGRPGFFAHNSRETKTTNSIFTDEKNFCSCDRKKAFEIFKQELSIRSNAYTQRTNQKLQKNTVTHLSAIVNFNKEHTPEDFEKVVRYIEEKFDTKVIQYSMHRDEGHINENGEIIKNYHAHIEFMGLDSAGNSIRRQLDKPTLRELQTDIADILNMERGRYTSYSKKEYEMIRRKVEKMGFTDKKDYNQKFRQVALNYMNIKEPKAKRLDTYEFKRTKEKEKQVKKEFEKPLKAQIDELKKEIANARKELQNNNAKREDYAKLEALNKQLQEQLKSKDIELAKAITVIQNLKNTIIKKDEKIKELENKINDIDEAIKKIDEMQKRIDLMLNNINSYINKIDELEKENKQLKEKIQEFETTNKFDSLHTKMLKEENEELKEENIRLLKQIESIQNTIVKKDITSYFIENNEFYGELQVKKAIKKEEEKKINTKVRYEEKEVEWVNVSFLNR